MDCLEHQKTHYSNSLVSNPPGVMYYNFEWWKCFCTGSLYITFSKDTKGAILDNNKKRTPPKLFYSEQTVYCTMESCIRLVFVSSLRFFTAYEVQQHVSRVIPNSTYTLFTVTKNLFHNRYLTSGEKKFDWNDSSSSSGLHAAPLLLQGVGMFEPRGADHGGVVQARPRRRRRRRVDGTGELGPGWSRDVEPPAAGEGQTVSGTGAHRIRGESHMLSVWSMFQFHFNVYYIYYSLLIT